MILQKGCPARLQQAPSRARGRRVTFIHCYQDTGAVGPVPVCFKITYRTNFGQQLGLVGNHCQWDPSQGTRMTWQEGDCWAAQLELKPGAPQELEYKYVVLNPDGQVSHWKPGSNFRVAVPSPEGNKVPKQVAVQDAWDEAFHDVQVTVLQMHPESAVTSSASATPLHSQSSSSAQLPHSQSASQESQASSSGSAYNTTYANGTSSARQPTSPPTSFPAAGPPQYTSVASSSTSDNARSNGSGGGAHAQGWQPVSTTAMTEAERLQHGIRSAVVDLSSQVERHQQLQQSTDDPAALEVLIADRIVAALNNKVVAYTKALKAVEAYAQLPTSKAAKEEAAARSRKQK